MKQGLWWHDIWDEICFWEQARSGRMRGWCPRSREVQWRRWRWAGQRSTIWGAQGGKVNHLSLLQNQVRTAASAGEFDRGGGSASVQETSCLLLCSPDILGFLRARSFLLQLHGWLHWVAAHSFPKPLHCNDGIQRWFWSCQKTKTTFIPIGPGLPRSCYSSSAAMWTHFGRNLQEWVQVIDETHSCARHPAENLGTTKALSAQE